MPILEVPVPATAKLQEAKAGERTLIACVGFHDTPEPGTGNLLGWAAFQVKGRSCGILDACR